ncbi:MAG TPA: response regulator transcription factor [Roseiflexaceae bacterium]|nr:response regulator transcription factor [Roseiflexaceae bacterium]
MTTPPVRASEPRQAGNDAGAPKRTVLVVDDEKAIAYLVADALEEEGYSVRVHHDGASALLDIINAPPDLVLLDIAMPVMVGDELLHYLRRHGYPDLPVIVMTAGLQPEAYLAQGANAVLPKPFDLERLLELVARHLAPCEERAAGAG